MNHTGMRRWIVAAVCAVLCAALWIPGTAPALAATPKPTATPSMKASPASSVAPYDKALPQELTADNLYATGAVLIDMATGKQLFAKDADRRLYPASTTKILTCLLALEHAEGDLDALVTCTSAATQVEPTKLGLIKGEEIPLIDLLYAMMLKSANDAAVAVAIYVGDSEKGFAEMMNEKAADLGCTDSNFVTPNGLPNTNHYSTAADMAKILRAAMSNATFREIVATTKYSIASTNKADARTVETKDKFLQNSGDADFSYEYGIGVKTGYTDASKHSFAGAANKDGIELLSVVLGSTTDGKWTDTIKLMNYGFAKYTALNIAKLYADNPRVLFNITGAEQDETETISLELVLENPGDPRLTSIMVSEDEKAEIETNFTSLLTFTGIDEVKQAPITQGEIMGTLTFQYKNIEPVTVNLVAASSIMQRLPPASTPPTPQEIQSSAQKKADTNWWWLLMLIPGGFIVFFAVGLGIEYHRRKTRSRARYSSYGRNSTARRYYR